MGLSEVTGFLLSRDVHRMVTTPFLIDNCHQKAVNIFQQFCIPVGPERWDQSGRDSRIHLHRLDQCLAKFRISFSSIFNQLPECIVYKYAALWFGQFDRQLEVLCLFAPICVCTRFVSTGQLEYGRAALPMTTKSKTRPSAESAGSISSAAPSMTSAFSAFEKTLMFCNVTSRCLGLISMLVTLTPGTESTNRRVEYPPRVPIWRMCLAMMRLHRRDRYWPSAGPIAMGGMFCCCELCRAASSDGLGFTSRD